MDGELLHNKNRFLNKINLMDACTTDPNILNFNKKNEIYLFLIL